MSDLISVAWNTTVQSVLDIRNTILISLYLFAVLVFICRSKKSIFDNVAAKNVSRVVALLTALEVLWLAPLIYCVYNLGSPILTAAVTTYDTGKSWLYGWGRPCFEISLIAFGVSASMHPVPRFLCIAGCICEMVFGSMSAFQIRNYLDQMVTVAAPAPPGYTRDLLWYYYWRDITSVGASTVLLMMTIHLTLLVGCCYPPLIPYRQLEGGDLDRIAIMRQQSRLRQHIDKIELQDDEDEKAERKRRRQEEKRRRMFTMEQIDLLHQHVPTKPGFESPV